MCTPPKSVCTLTSGGYLSDLPPPCEPLSTLCIPSLQVHISHISHRGVYPPFVCILSPGVLLLCVCIFITRESAKPQTICLRDLERKAHHLCVYPLSGCIACLQPTLHTAPHTAVPLPFVSVPVVKCKLPLAPPAMAQRSQGVAPKQSGATAKCQSCFQASQRRKRSPGL